MVARCRRSPTKTSSPYLVGHIVGRTGLGLVAGGRRPSSLDVPHVGIFFRGEVRRKLRLQERCNAVLDGQWFNSLQWRQATTIEGRF